MNRHDESHSAAPPTRDEGFTLIELLIVIAILGILSTIVVLSVRGITDRGSSAACSSDEKSLENAYEAYVAKGTPAFTTGSFETFLVTSGFLHSESTKYDVASDGTISAQSGGGCTVATPVAFTSAQAGTPGAWLPAGATAPATLQALIAANLFLGPQPWNPGQYVVLGDGSRAAWRGPSFFQNWIAMPWTDAVEGTPGHFLPLGVAPPADLAALQDSGLIPTSGASDWNGGYVLLADNDQVAWVSGQWQSVS